jgi:cytochrome c peroxidase
MADARALPIGTGGHGLGPQRTFLAEVTLGEEASQVRRLAGTTDAASGQTVAPNPFVGAFVPRNAPTIINSALFPAQFWDSRVEHYGEGAAVHTLEDFVNDLGLHDPLLVQALFPITSLHEMAGATLGDHAPQTIRRALLNRLRATPEYRQQFAAAWDTPGLTPEEQITLERVAAALAAFQRRMIHTDAPWDAYLDGDAAALTMQQKRGALLFYGRIDPAVNCAQCHSGNLFSDFAHHNLLVPQLGPGKGHGYSGRADWGRGGVTFDARDRYAFRTPALRNVELTAPYFHDGAFATLTGTIRHHADIWHSAATYDPGEHGIPPALYSSLQPFAPQRQGSTAAPELRHGLPLSEHDIADLVAFLHSLTDPAARDLGHLVPAQVPSGLPLDPLPAAPAAPLVHEPPRAPDVPPASDGGGVPPAPRLRDVAAEVGLDFRHGAFRTAISEDPAAAMGGGLCWLDYDNDGWLDLYLVNSYAEDEADYWQQQGGLPHSVLYRNAGGTFREVSRTAGADLRLRGNGCVAADFDRDGWTDLYITADGPNALLWNNGDGTFAEGAAAAGVAAPEWNSAAVVGDLNADGWPDLFVASYIDLNHTIPRPSGAFPQDYYGLPDRLYLSSGPTPDGRVSFREVSRAAGLERAERGLGALLSDLDQDGDLDLYIANDGQPNRMYANEPRPDDAQGIGFRFVDLTGSANAGDSGSGMGIAGGDYDGDGLVDLFVTNWERELNALYRNEYAEAGHLTFRYSTFRIGLAGLGNGITGWGTALLDIDHDTDQDLLIVNGRVPVTNLASDPERVRLYRNISQDGTNSAARRGHFREWTEAAGLEEVGPLLARGSAAADYDNDGDLDIAINTIAGQAVLLRNAGTGGNWLHVALPGFHPGARLRATLPDGRTLVRELYAGSSYLASEDPRLHLGLGTARSLPALEVRWPDGRTLRLRDVPANRILVLQPPAALQ